MARTKNQLETASVTLSTTPPVLAYLKQLVASGLYGKSPPEAAERLVAQGIERLIREGTLTRLQEPSK